MAREHFRCYACALTRPLDKDKQQTFEIPGTCGPDHEGKSNRDTTKADENSKGVKSKMGKNKTSHDEVEPDEQVGER